MLAPLVPRLNQNGGHFRRCPPVYPASAPPSDLAGDDRLSDFAPWMARVLSGLVPFTGRRRAGFDPALPLTRNKDQRYSTI
jgi:hypothetical protein